MNSMSERMNEPARSEGRHGAGRWIAGIALILVGAGFLVQNLTGVWLDNWWALFIAVPGVMALAAATDALRRNQWVFDAGIGRVALGGIVPLVVATIFFFELDWGRVWPVFLIIGGLWVLVQTRADAS